MLKNGKYVAWFKTPQGEGTGYVTLDDGRMTGGDAIIAYAGSYQQDGDNFTATITTHRQAEGHASIFGIDDIDLTLSGRSLGKTVSCTGSAKQAPGVLLQATLIKVDD